MFANHRLAHESDVGRIGRPGDQTRRSTQTRQVQERQLMAKWDEDPIPEERESLCVSGMKVAPEAREQQARDSKREG
jgi:hypothetical protein